MATSRNCRTYTNRDRDAMRYHYRVDLDTIFTLMIGYARCTVDFHLQDNNHFRTGRPPFAYVQDHYLTANLLVHKPSFQLSTINIYTDRILYHLRLKNNLDLLQFLLRLELSFSQLRQSGRVGLLLLGQTRRAHMVLLNLSVVAYVRKVGHQEKL
jgi:hypothetical protein